MPTHGWEIDNGQETNKETFLENEMVQRNPILDSKTSVSTEVDGPLEILLIRNLRIVNDRSSIQTTLGKKRPYIGSNGSQARED